MGCLFAFLIVSFDAQTFLIFMKSSPFIFPLSVGAFGVISEKLLPQPRSQRLTSICSSKRPIVLALTCSSISIVNCLYMV